LCFVESKAERDRSSLSGSSIAASAGPTRMAPATERNTSSVSLGRLSLMI
jgi:hypothetical protein